MRLKLLRRRLSISAPRMIVRSHLPWPLRWAVVALMFGFSAALALWAFEFGKNIAGLDRHSADELERLRVEVMQLRSERETSVSGSNTVQSLLTAEKTVQEKLAGQLKRAEAENLQLKADLGFFERLLPAGAAEGLVIRGLQAELKAPGQLRVQLLVMQSGKRAPEFNGRYDTTLNGTLDGKPWVFARPGGAQALQLKQYARVESVTDYPPQAVVKTVSVRVMDLSGAVRATLTVKP
ncbi:MAG: DUF6776 family protein [Burkholderiales bacterium]